MSWIPKWLVSGPVRLLEIGHLTYPLKPPKVGSPRLSSKVEFSGMYWNILECGVSTGVNPVFAKGLIEHKGDN